jgi:hypothetical protein
MRQIRLSRKKLIDRFNEKAYVYIYTRRIEDD